MQTNLEQSTPRVGRPWSSLQKEVLIAFTSLHGCVVSETHTRWFAERWGAKGQVVHLKEKVKHYYNMTK